MRGQNDGPLIIAHRGASAVAPENTLAAFERGIKDGADGIEFDVRLAADGQPVIFHDPTLERIAGQRLSISDLSSRDLANIDVGSWFNKASPKFADRTFSKEGIPTLGLTLQTLDDFRGRIYVELKIEEADAAPLVKALAGAIRDSKLLSQVIVKSFRLSAIGLIREILPGVRTAALFEPKVRTLLRKKRFVVDLAKEFGADELSLHYSLVTRGSMKRAREEKLPVTAWTVDKPKRARQLADLGVFAIITNDPQQLRNLT